MQSVLSERKCIRCGHVAAMVVEAELEGIESPRREQYVGTLMSLVACPSCGEDSGKQKWARVAKRVHRFKLYAPAVFMYGLAWLMGDRSSLLITLGPTSLAPDRLYESWALTIGVLVIISILTWDRSRKMPFDFNPLGVKASFRVVSPEVAEQIKLARKV